MAIRGFIGFWSYLKGGVFSQSLCDIYKANIVDSVHIRKDFGFVIATNDYLCSDDENLVLNAGACDIPDSNALKISIEVTKTQIEINRDRWGTRSINYCCVEGGIYFASDVRFLLALPIPEIAEYDQMSLTESATLGYIYSEERTLFKKIKQVPRNSELIYSISGLKITRNIISADKDRFKDIGSAVSSFGKAFESTVANATKITGNKAYFLSGGIDSTALVLIAANHLDKLNTVSFASENNSEDIYYAKKVSKSVGSDHTIIQFDEQKILEQLPSFLHDIENVEFEGIFSPLGGYAYYVLCAEVAKFGFNVIFPGEGADEILAGYYWSLTHTFGFVDRLRENSNDDVIYAQLVKLFPEVEDRNLYREIAYYFLQGSALTNYHLNCIEHSAKAFDLYSYPIYMTTQIDEVVRDVPMKWLCDGENTKIILKEYIRPRLKRINLSELISRKKSAMPSVIPISFMKKINSIAKCEACNSENPYWNILQDKPLNILLLDVLHKYYTLRPLEKIDILEWKEDLERIDRNERIVHW